jgi:hypothetical protein
MELHDHLMFFILMIFVLKIVFFSKSLWTATVGTRLVREPLYPYKGNLNVVRATNADYVKENIEAGGAFRSATLLEFI